MRLITRSLAAGLLCSALAMLPASAQQQPKVTGDQGAPNAGGAAAWPVSAAALPLPAGAATAAGQAPLDAAPTGSPYSGTTASTIGTFSTAGYATVDLDVTAYAGGTIVLEEQASDGSANWVAVPLVYGPNQYLGLSIPSGTMYATGLWRASIYGQTARVRIVNAPGGTDTVAVSLKVAPYVIPSTYVNGGSVTALPGVSAAAGGVASFSRIVSSAGTTNATLAKASTGRVYKIFACNTTTSDFTIHMTSLNTIPIPGTTPVLMSRPFPASATAGKKFCQSYDMADVGWSFPGGIGYWISTGDADTDATALAAGAATAVSIEYQ